MQESKQVAGIDGCRDGWCIALLSTSECIIRTVRSLHEIIELIRHAGITLIDIPLGLTDQNFSRTIETSMRTVLPREKKSSVFTPPCREALSATNYEEAAQNNWLVTGKKISLQSYYIMPKIREADELLNQHPHLRDKMYESHPEICFQYLNDNNPLSQSKKTKAGIDERLTILEQYRHGIHETYDYFRRTFTRSEAQSDDLVDALCLGLTAHLAECNGLQFIEDSANLDSRGIPVKIAYYET